MNHRRACVMPLLAAALLFPAMASAEVRVTKKPVVIDHRTFDPANPPKEMPALHEHEVALCTYDFDCSNSVGFTQLRRDLPGGKCRMTYHIEKVKVTVGLHIIVWLPKGVTTRVSTHEEGHRQIAEYYYKEAERFGKLAGAQLDSHRIEGEGPDCEKAANDALQAANQKAADAFMAMTAVPCQRAQVIFDDLTDHSRKEKPDVATAVHLAIDQQAAEARKAAAPATRPTTAPTTKPAKPAKPAGH